MEDAQHVGPNPDVISNRGLVDDRGFDRSEREVDRSSDREVDRSREDRSESRQRPDFDTPGDRSARFREHFEEARREVNGADEEPEDYTERSDRSRYKSVRDAASAAVKEDTEKARDEHQAAPEVSETEAAPREIQANQAPTSWTKEARDHWPKLPERIQQEVRKREEDMERGVKQLQAHYKEIDDVIAPYHDHISGYGKTAAQTVDQMFKWYDALAKNPDEAIPALVRSYGHNPYRAATALIPDVAARFNNMNQELMVLRAYAAHTNPQARAFYQQTANKGQQQQFLQNLVQQAVAQQWQQQRQQQAAAHQQEFTAYQQQVERQREADTSDWLEGWGKDKRHFKTVRVLMGQLLTPDQTTGQAVIPLKDNKVDLDGAYEAAVQLHPELRKARQQAKEKQERQQEKALQARRAGSSITTSPPGYNNGGGRGSGQKKGVTVRESLRQAISELSDR